MSFGSPVESQMAWNEMDLAMKFPLHKACKDGDQNSIPLLLENNALLARTEDCFLGWTPAHWAAYFGQTDCLMTVLTYLVPSFSTVDIQTSKNFLTPAHCAAQGGRAQCLQYLLGAGANPSAKDASGEIPLHKACRIGNAECVRVLVESCRDTRVSNNMGHTPSAVAVLSGFPAIANYINKTDMMRELGRKFSQNGTNGNMNGFYHIQNAVNAYVSQHNGLNGCRKRSLDSDCIGAKKMRSEDVIHEVCPPLINGTFNFAIASVPQALSSVVEHENLCRMDSGYSNAFLECMISEFHGC